MAAPRKRSRSLQPFLLDGIRQVGSATLGDGSYATVVPLSFRGLKCAGKKLHTILYDNASPQEKECMIERFQEECQLLSRIKHPNFVQFLGIHFEEGSNLPVLVMELLHCTLSECLERDGVLQARVCLGILDDVATGLCYLHGHRPPIVHRDLSSNNVLLSSDMNAKISDLGMAKILNMTPVRMSQRTKCPGTPAYMPPEALEEDPEYSTELDCFSMGVMILHVLCGSWPIPSKPTCVDPRNRKRVIGLTEVKRREKYFQQIRGDHPFLDLIHGCLDNNPPQRPDAERILGRIRQVTTQSPPSPENKMELLSQIETLRNENKHFSEQLEQSQKECEQLREVSNEVVGLRVLVRTKDEEKRSLSEQHQQLQGELTQSRGKQEQLDLTHSSRMEMVQCRVRELLTEVEGLRAVLKSKEEVVRAKEMEKQQAIQAKETEKEQAIQAKEIEKQQAIQAKEIEKQQAIQAKEHAIQTKETEKEQAIQAKEIEKQQAIQAKEQAIQAKETEKEQAIQAKEEEKQQAIQAKETEKEQAIQAKAIEKWQAIQAKEQTIQAKEQTIQAKEGELATKQKVIECMQQEMASKDSLLAAKDETISSISDRMKMLATAKQSLHPLHPQSSLHWQRCADMPKLLKFPVSVFIGDVMFVAGWESCDVLRYDTTSDKWSVLLSCPMKYCGIGQLSGKLVTVGGCNRSAMFAFGTSSSNVYTYEEETQQWEESIPAMPTPRIDPTVVTYHSSIAVCGGCKYGGLTVYPLVEVFNSKTSQWYIAAPLPVAYNGMHVTVINDTCYLGGGRGIGNKCIMCASLPSLFQPTKPRNQVWTKLPNLPHGWSALTNMWGTVLALGGGSGEDIFAYYPNTKAWVKIGYLPQTCDAAIAEVLPSGAVMLIGGRDKQNNWLKTVYIGTLQLKQS